MGADGERSLVKAQRFGRYVLLDKVASGGMAEVWRAKIMGEGGFQRLIAIKKILSHVSEDPEFISMFTDEANITVQLQHPNIGQVYEFSKLEDIYYIAMEYISGKDVKSLWSHMRQRKGVIPPKLSCLIVQKMAEGLSYAHNKKDNFGNSLGIVHRDVSPQNVLISWDGEVRVIDFGIAKADDKQSRTRAGTLKGKFAYMSPEQIRGLRLDGRADTFALGVVLYELLTGERGFSAESEFSLLEKVRNVEIKPPTMVNRDIPPDLERIVFKALAKDRDDRYQDAADLAEDLQRFLLAEGKAPKAAELGEFLRQNFTVEYDKERLRLESYKEVELEPEPEPVAPAAPAAPAAPPPDPAMDAVAAAMAAENTGVGGDPSGAFANSPGAQNTVTQTFVQPGGGAARPAGGSSTSFVMSRPGVDHTAATPVRQAGFAPPMQRNANQGGAKSGGGGLGMVAKIAIAVVLVAVLAGGGVFAALSLTKGNGTIVVTVLGSAQDATVRIDGAVHPQKANPSVTIDGIAAGEHTLIVERSGYKTHTAQVIVDKGKPVTLNVPLKKVGGVLRVTSSPSGAAVILDGVATGEKTPTTLDDVEGGAFHKIELKLDGYKTWSQDSITLEPGSEKTLKASLSPGKLVITVQTDPKGAELKVGDKVLGKTPYDLDHDPEAAPPKVTLSKDGCEDYTTSIPFDSEKPKQSFQLTLKCN
jgi:hypothetical protein